MGASGNERVPRNAGLWVRAPTGHRAQTGSAAAAAPPLMTAFSTHDTPPGETPTGAYEDLRRYAALTSGRPPRARRICSLSRRHEGADSEPRVGDDYPAGRETVHAIFESAMTTRWCGAAGTRS